MAIESAPMKCRLISRSLLSQTLLAILLIVSTTQAQEYQGDVTDVQVIDHVDQHAGSNLLWIPYIAQWKPKHFVVAYAAGIPGKGDMGDVLASLSTNDGKTWEYPVTIFDHHQKHGNLQFGYANPVLYHPPGQDVIWCFCMRCPINYRHSEDSQLAAAYSGDGGRSWFPVELAMGYTGPLIIVGGIHRIEENGIPRYLLPAQRNSLASDPTGDRVQFVLESTSLLDWKMKGAIPQPASGPIFLHEGTLAQGNKPGELKLVMRTSQYTAPGKAIDSNLAYSSVSQDGGKTWSVAAPEADLWNTVSKAHFDTVGQNQHIYVYSSGPAWERKTLNYRVQDPAGVWGPELTFYDSKTKNSYPTLIETAPGEFAAVWDSGTPDRMRTNIRFGRLKVAPVAP